MASAMNKLRKKWKEEEPERYQAYLEQQRIYSKKLRDEKKRKWAEEVHTRAMVEERERELELKRERGRRYRENKAEKAGKKLRRKRRSSPTSKATPPAKRRVDMTEDERRQHDTRVRSEYNHALSPQKKDANRTKNKERMREKRKKKEEKEQKSIVEGTVNFVKRLPKTLLNVGSQKMAGRGRGRGRSRGILDLGTAATPGGLQDKTGDEDQQAATNAGDHQNHRQDSNSQPTLSLSDMQTILQDTRTYSDSSDTKHVLMCALNFVRTAEDVKTLSSLIYNKCLEDSMLAKRGSEICNSLTTIEVGTVQFRSCLLTLVQGDYKAREDLIREDPSRFNGFTAFLCEIFAVMRTNTNEIFKPLVSPIFECFNTILGPQQEEGEENSHEFEINEDACENMAMQLQSVGRLLEVHGEEKLTHLMDRIRTCIINSRSPARVRCCLLEVVEAYARGWDSASNHTAQFYCDMAVDIISGLIL